MLSGEFGMETDTGMVKIGDGIHVWSALTYQVTTTRAGLGIATTDAVQFARLGVNTPPLSAVGIVNKPSDGTNGPGLLLDASLITTDREPPLLVKNSQGVITTAIMPDGGIILNTELILAGNHAQLGTLDANGVFTQDAGGFTSGNGLSCMLDIASDTNMCIAARVSSAGGAYAIQWLDKDKAFVHSVEADGSLKWGAPGVIGAANHAAMDTTLGRVSGGAGQQGNLLASGGATPIFMIGNSYADSVYVGYSASAIVLRSPSNGGVVDLYTIQPSGGADFRIRQNSVDVLTSVASGAIANTLSLSSGRVGVGAAAPSGCVFYVADPANAMTMRVGNNSFGSDWVVFNQDSGLSSTKYFLAASQTGSGQTIVNTPSGGFVDIRVANSSVLKVQAGGVITMATGSLPTADPHVVGQLWRSGTALQVSLG